MISAPLPTDPKISRAYRKVACESSLLYFIRKAWPLVEPKTPYVHGWHTDAMSEHLTAVTKGQIKDLLINISPSSGKSTLVSVLWPCWQWTLDPSERMMFASYAQGLSNRDSIKRRQLITSEWFQSNWQIELTDDTNKKEHYENTRTGWMLSTSVLGQGTGQHPNIFVGDDLHNVLQSESDKQRQEAIDWFDGTISSRGIGVGVRKVVIGQRLHERDISGHLIDQGDWCHLCIPMEYEGRRKATVLGWEDPRRTPGELFFPQFLTAAVVDTLKKRLGSYRSAGQLQQRPAPAGGGLFKRAWFEIVNAVPAGTKAHRHWDLAATEQTPGVAPDWTAGVRMRKTADNFFFIDSVIRMQESAYTVERAILNTAGQDGIAVSLSVPQDPGQAGKAQAKQFLRQLAGYTISTVLESGSKETRATPFSAQCEAGNVKLLKGPWNEDFLAELEVFPNGANDDQVDAASHAFHKLLGAGVGTMVKLRGF